MDVPYVPSEWNVLRDRDYAKDPNKVGGAAVLWKILGLKMKLKQWSQYTWKDSEELQKEELKGRKKHAESVKAQEQWATEQFEQGNISEAEYTLTNSLAQELNKMQKKNAQSKSSISCCTGYGINPDGTSNGPGARNV